jgi:hypothetical protein
MLNAYTFLYLIEKFNFIHCCNVLHVGFWHNAELGILFVMWNWQQVIVVIQTEFVCMHYNIILVQYFAVVTVRPWALACHLVSFCSYFVIADFLYNTGTPGWWYLYLFNQVFPFICCSSVHSTQLHPIALAGWWIFLL